ncbi:MAG: hypothetical protein O9301_03580 [Leptospira sp.]|nr:hypothetical protein [Leptospira sp.]
MRSSKFNKSLFQILISLGLILMLPGCKEKPMTMQDISTYQSEYQGSNLEFGAKYLPKLLGPHFKSIEEGLGGNQKKEIHLVYGGNTALTFTDEKEYQNYTISFHKLILLRMALLLKVCTTENYSLSLSKPFFVKGETNPETEIQEFEVLRTTIPKSKVDSILLKYKNWNVLENPKLDSETWLKISKEIDEAWIVELNELSRVSLE